MAPAPPITFLSVSLAEWLTIIAILTGPLAALWIQKHLEERRARVDRKVKIFRDLMANRASRLSATYVQSLNGIETEFYDDRKVIEAWRVLVNHLYAPQGGDNATQTQWGNQTTDLLNDTLYEMGKSLGYHFDKVTLKRNVYYPAGWNTIEMEQTKVRQSAIKVFEGERALKVELTNPAPPDAPIAPRRIGDVPQLPR